MERVAEKPSLSIARSYPVAPEKVWRAWTDPQAVKQWWGPGPGEPVSLAELDVLQGGGAQPQAGLHLVLAEQHA
jgi:uncharacterized protein YndB with AHSA1/START domain